MCDTTTILTNQSNVHSCWIVYTKSEGKERLTVTEKKSDSSAEDISDNNCSNEATNATIGVSDDTEKALHLMLDPELQPETPDPNLQLSQEIFQEHQKLAKEYLRVDTELYYATDRKEKLLASMDPDEKQEKLTIIKKLMEKEDLLGLYKDLQKQLEQIKICQGLSESESSRNIVQEQQQQHQQQQSSSSSSSSQTILKSSTDEEPPDQNEDGWVFITSNQS